MILLIDHFDSFVHNLARYFIQLGYQTTVIRSNKISVAEIEKINPSHIVLSPGPCAPIDVPVSIEIVRKFHAKMPILGVCLGHQIIAEAFGGLISHAKKPMHGKSSFISHNNLSIMKNLPQPLKVGRYHSLIVAENNFPDCLTVLAHSDENEIMAFSHQKFPTVGVQFHPESVLTDEGYLLLQNFLDS